MIPVPDGAQVLEPEGILQDVVLLEIQTKRSTAVPPSLTEEDVPCIPVLMPYTDSIYEPETGILGASKDAATTLLTLLPSSNIDAATTRKTLATRSAGTRAGCSDLDTIWESDSHTVAGAELPANVILELMPCTPNACPYMPTTATPVSSAEVRDVENTVGPDTSAANASEETRIDCKEMDAAKLAFLEDTRRHATTESEAQVEAAQADPILKRGLKSMI